MSKESQEAASAGAASALSADEEMDVMLSTLTRRGGRPLAGTAVDSDAARERDEYLADLQRISAEFDNYQKRAQREKESAAALARTELIREMLPVLDNLERALQVVGEGGSPEIAQGLQMVEREVHALFAQQGVEEIPTEGTFDPLQHEPLLSVPSGQPEGTIIDVLQKGYRVGSQVLRPARVSVAAPAPEEGRA